MEKQKLKERKINKKSHITLHTSQNSGITLVALIITIIVLLILAVVAIRAVQEDGIITKAKEAKSKTTVAQEKEQIGLATSEWRIQKNYQNEPSTNFKSFMTATLKNADSIDGDPAGPLTVIMKGTGNEYLVKEDGTIKPPSNIKYVYGDENLGYYIVILKPDNYNKQKAFLIMGEIKMPLGEYTEGKKIEERDEYAGYTINDNIKDYENFIENEGTVLYALNDDHTKIYLVQDSNKSVGIKEELASRNDDVDLSEIEAIISK